MITADEALKIVNTKLKDVHNSPLFRYAIGQIDRYVRDASSYGYRSFSYNVNALAPGHVKPSLLIRKAIAEELRKNGFSYSEDQRSLGCVWFVVSW